MAAFLPLKPKWRKRHDRRSRRQCNSTLWAACIGGAAQRDSYRAQIEAAGLRVVKEEDNPQYQFISENAQGASKKFGAKSVSLLARKA
jgi:arsenite methyltransferase